MKSTNVTWKLIWKDEVYEASDDERIRNSKTGKILNQRKKRSGYWYVKLCPQNTNTRRTKREYLVHRVICMAWKKKYTPQMVVDHIKTKRNIPSNLEWVTKKENLRRRWQHKYTTPYIENPF